MKNQSPKQPAKRSAKRPAPVGNGETAQGAPSQAANPSGGNADAAQGTAGESVRQWHGKTDGETEAQYLRRAFEWDGAELSAMGAASDKRRRRACMVLYYGLQWAIENGAGYDDILNRPEMLRAVECLINDPPEIAAAFMRPNPNPVQGGVDKETREWYIATIQEYADNIADESGRVVSDWFTPPWGMSLFRAHFEMFPICLNLACVPLRQTWAKFITVCGLPEFAEMREWLEHDRKEAGRGYVQMPALFEVAYSEEQYFDLNTGEVNAPKYGGGGIKAAALLLNFREYLRERQAANGCAPVAEDRKPDEGAADRNAAARESLHGKPDAAQGAANPSGVAGVLHPSGNVIIYTAAPVQVNAPEHAKQKPAGNSGLSLSEFAALLKHYGGKHHGQPYKKRQLVNWGKKPKEKRKRVYLDGEWVVYSPEMLFDSIKARRWAMQLNLQNEQNYKARKARI